MNARALIFAVWVNAGKDRTQSILALENIASGQVNVFNKGGKTMVSSSVGNESFSFQLSGSLSADVVQTLAYDAWRAVNRFTTDSAFLEWIKADEVSSITAGFSNMVDL
jgi:hypothetical protein